MANSNNRRRFPAHNRRTKPIAITDDAEHVISISQNLFDECEKIKAKILPTSTNSSDLWLYRQELLDRYDQLILFDLDYALEKKIEHDLWTLVFKNDMTYKQEQLKVYQQQSTKRIEIQTSLQTLYEYARGYYLKLLQDVVHVYNFKTSICKLSFPFLHKATAPRQCKEASMLYFLQHILVHVGDLNRYSNQIDLAKVFYQYAIQTIPCLGQPYNQIAILHEMKNPLSLLTPGHNQLITTYYYVRSVAIKVTFPLAIANLEKLFQRLKDIPLSRYEQSLTESDFFTLFLQLIAMINLEMNLTQIEAFMAIFRSRVMKHFNLNHFTHLITIIMFTLHRALGLLPRSSAPKTPERQFDITLQLLMITIDQCLEAIQLPHSMMIVDEHQILPILYLSFAYLANIQKTKADLFEHHAFKQKTTMWSSLAKLLRSFSVCARNLDKTKDATVSLFVKYADYPLLEERTLECFTPLNDLLKVYNFKKYDEQEQVDECLSEKDERQLRKLRFVSIVRNLCSKTEDLSTKKTFDFLLTYVKDDLVCFESSTPVIPQMPSTNFGVPGDRRTIQKPTNDGSRSPNASTNQVKIPRGARNVALRQFLDPGLAAAGTASTQKVSPKDSVSFPRHLDESDAWPRLTTPIESNDLIQAPSIDDQSHLDAVWSSHDDPPDRFPHQLLGTGLMFTHASPSKPTTK